MAETTIQEQIVKENPQIEAYRIGLLQSAKDLASSPVTIPAYQVAGLSPYEQQAMQLAQQGLGAYQPYLNTANQALQGAGTSFAQISPIASQLAQQGQATMAGAQPFVNQFNQIGSGSIGAGVGYGNAASGVASGTAAATQPIARAMQGLGVGGLNSMYAQGQDISQYGQAAAGSLSPFIGQSARLGMQGLAQGQPYQAALNQLSAQSVNNVPGMYDTGITEQFMDPYRRAVTEQSLRDIRRQADIDMTGLRARGVAAGAYGGSRQAIAEQEFQRNVTDTMARTIAQDNSANYMQAQQAGMSAFEADRQRRLAGLQQGMAGMQASAGIGAQGVQQALAGLGQGMEGTVQGGQLGMQGMQSGIGATQAGYQYGLGAMQGMGELALNTGAQGLNAVGLAGQYGMMGREQALQGAQMGAGTYLDAQRTGLGALQSSGQMYGSLGEAYGNLGGQFANLGAMGTQLNQEQSRYLAMLGGVQRENSQAALDASRQTQLARQYEPYQRLGFLSDVYAKTPTTQSTIAQSTSPSASGLSSALGSGIQAYAMYQGMNNLWGNQ